MCNMMWNKTIYMQYMYISGTMKRIHMKLWEDMYSQNEAKAIAISEQDLEMTRL